MMKNEPAIPFVGVLVKVIDPIRVEKGGAAFDAMYLVAFSQEEFGQVRSVLAGNARNQCHFVHIILLIF